MVIRGDPVGEYCTRPSRQQANPSPVPREMSAALAKPRAFPQRISPSIAAFISLGTGLGFACCLDGRVQYSPTGSPRITIYKTPFRDGILEDYASKRAFLRIYGEITGRGTEPSLTVADLGRMAGEGDPAARETFATVGRTLGEALRARILEERIECLLLGGQISRSYIHLEPGLRKGLHGAECLRRIAPAAHIGHAAFYGLLARIDDLQTEA